MSTSASVNRTVPENVGGPGNQNRTSSRSWYSKDISQDMQENLPLVPDQNVWLKLSPDAVRRVSTALMSASGKNVSASKWRESHIFHIYGLPYSSDDQRAVHLTFIPPVSTAKYGTSHVSGNWKEDVELVLQTLEAIAAEHKAEKAYKKEYNESVRRALIGYEKPPLPTPAWMSSSSSSSAAPDLPNPPRRLPDEVISRITKMAIGQTLKPDELQSEALKKIQTERRGKGRKKRARRTRRRAGKK